MLLRHACRVSIESVDVLALYVSGRERQHKDQSQTIYCLGTYLVSQGYNPYIQTYKWHIIYG